MADLDQRKDGAKSLAESLFSSVLRSQSPSESSVGEVGTEQQHQLDAFARTIVNLSASAEPVLADAASMPMWEGLKTVVTFPVEDPRRALWIVYLSSACPFLRSTRCFSQPGQPGGIDLGTAHRAALDKKETTGFSFSQLNETITEAQRTLWREFSGVARFASSLGTIEDATSAAAQLPRFVSQRNINTDKLCELLPSCCLLASSGSTPGRLDEKKLCFSPQAVIAPAVGSSSPRTVALPEGVLPLELFIEVVFVYLMMHLFLPLSANQDIPYLSKLLNALEELPRSLPVSSSYRLLFSGLLKNILLRDHHRVAVAQALGSSQSWSAFVPSWLQSALFRHPEENIDGGGATPVGSACFLLNKARGIEKSSKQARSCRQQKFEDKLMLVTAKGEAVGDESMTVADDAHPSVPPCVVDLGELQDTLSSRVGMEVEFNDGGASNSLRDLDLIIKHLRCISRAPIETAPTANSTNKSISLQFLKDLHYRRDCNSVSVVDVAQEEPAAAAGRKRPRDDDGEDGTGVSQAPLAKADPRRQSRVVLPVPAGIDGAYKDIGHRPPLEATWYRHFHQCS